LTYSRKCSVRRGRRSTEFGCAVRFPLLGAHGRRLEGKPYRALPPFPQGSRRAEVQIRTRSAPKTPGFRCVEACSWRLAAPGSGAVWCGGPLFEVNCGESVLIGQVPGGQVLIGKGRRGGPRAVGPAGIVTQVAKTHDPSPCRMIFGPWCRVEGTEVKSDDVAGLSRASADAGVGPPSRRVPHRFETLCTWQIRRVVFETVGDESSTRGMAGAKTAQCNRFGNRIKRYPQTDVVHAIDSVIGIVVVPGSGRDGSRFLHQNVFVEETWTTGSQESTRDLGQRTVEGGVTKLMDSLPAHVVVEETTARTFGCVVVRPITGIGHVFLHPDRECIKHVPWHDTPKHDESLAMVRLNIGTVDENAHIAQTMSLSATIRIGGVANRNCRTSRIQRRISEQILLKSAPSCAEKPVSRWRCRAPRALR